MQKIYYCLMLSAILALCSQSQSLAQQVNKKALEKANWYSAPREFQIIDDRPVVKDFREGPQQAGTVDLGGPGGGAGSGAGGGGGGSGNGNIPAGGLHFGKPSVRTVDDGLPKSGFGSNIPARGLSAGAANSLPSGGLKSYTGSSKAPQAGSLPAVGHSSYVPHRGAPSTRTAAAPVAPATVRSYGGNYSTAPASRPSSSSEQQVHGKLLRSK
jgi:hypothetical protein